MTGTLTYKKGCLIEAAKTGRLAAIAHQANCFNTMKSGIAPLIVAYCPEAGEADQKTSRGDIAKLGTTTHGFSKNVVMVWNLYGQYKYGREPGVVYTDYVALTQAMTQMGRWLYQSSGSNKIGLPRLGCGLAGGDWAIVEQIIKDTLVAYGHHVTIYEKE